MPFMAINVSRGSDQDPEKFRDCCRTNVKTFHGTSTDRVARCTTGQKTVHVEFIHERLRISFVQVRDHSSARAVPLPLRCNRVVSKDGKTVFFLHFFFFSVSTSTTAIS